MKNFTLKHLFARSGKTKERRSKNRVPLEDETILIVDDSRTVLVSLSRTLASGGLRTLEASSGEQGIEMARQYRPDLILMDVVLPGINGYRATRTLHKDPQTKDIPVIIISGSDDAAETFWSKRCGAANFLKKPVSRGDLFHAVTDSMYNGGDRQSPVTDTTGALPRV